MASTDDGSSDDNRSKWKFYFDGDCGLCRWFVQWICRMDFSSGITWISVGSLMRPPHGLSWEDLDRAAYLQVGEGKFLEGFYAIRMLTRKVPALWPLAPVFWLPGVHVPGRAVYRWVAANRYRLSRCPVPDRRRGPDEVPAAAPGEE
jgi:predicted DCC family thiol-disulfide oxidoreductase YuxK